MPTMRPAYGGPLIRAMLLILAAAVCSLALSARAVATPLELGIDRSNLTLESEAVRRSTIEGISALHAAWFRDVANAPTARPDGLAKLVDELRQAKAARLKVLLNIVQLDDDFDNNNAGAPRNKCGWSERKFSAINPARLTQRIDTLIGALRAARIDVDAFEIGNEDDSYCYNADVPNGHYATPEELQTAVRGYAHFLAATAQIIQRPGYYPRAKLITFGIAHASDKWDNPPHHISQPARFIAMLRNVDGVNYLSNSRYHVDGFGTHVYAYPNDIAGSITRTLEQDAAILGRGKPFWVTEWGFLNLRAFPTNRGVTLSDALREFLATFERLEGSIPLGPIMFYSYNIWLVDSGGQFLPQARVLAQFASGR